MSSVSSPKIEHSTSSASAPGPAHKRKHLTFHNVANIFVRLRRHQRSTRLKNGNISASSGDSPKTHPELTAEDLSQAVLLPKRHEIFVCVGGVDIEKLLRASRASLLEAAEAVGGTALVNERWGYSVVGPRNRPSGSYRVEVEYRASAARVSCRDPRKPVALEHAIGIPGLMTIVKRDS